MRYVEEGEGYLVFPYCKGLMEISHHENEIGLFVFLDEPSSILVVYPESVKPFDCTFEGFEIERRMEGIAEK
jgi:hypothetical protein